MTKDGHQRGSNPCAPHSVQGVPPYYYPVSASYSRLQPTELRPLLTIALALTNQLYSTLRQSHRSPSKHSLCRSRSPHSFPSNLPSFHVLPQPSPPIRSIPFIHSLPPTTTAINAPSHIAIPLLHISGSDLLPLQVPVQHAGTHLASLYVICIQPHVLSDCDRLNLLSQNSGYPFPQQGHLPRRRKGVPCVTVIHSY